MRVKILRPMWDFEGRKYIEFESQGTVYSVKVPFRYNRVMCVTDGLKTIHDLQRDDMVEVHIEWKSYKGHGNWVISYLNTSEAEQSLII